MESTSDAGDSADITYCQPCALSGKKSPATIVCQDCPSPKRYWCDACKGGHNAFTTDHRIVLLSEYFQNPTRFPLSGDDSCPVPSHAGQKLLLVCLDCNLLLCTACAHDVCLAADDSAAQSVSCKKHNIIPLAKLIEGLRSTLKESITEGADNTAKTLASIAELVQQKGNLADIVVSVGKGLDEAAELYICVMKEKACSYLSPYTEEVDKRLVDAEASLDNRRNDQLEAETLLMCKNDVEVYRKATRISGRLKEGPMTALPALPSLELVPFTSEQRVTESSDTCSLLKDFKWIPPIAHKVLPQLVLSNGIKATALACSCFFYGSSHLYVDIFGPNGGLYILSAKDNIRRKISDDVLRSVCVAEDGLAAYAVGENGVMQKYSIAKEGGKVCKVKTAKLRNVRILGVSVLSGTGNVVVSSMSCIYILSPDLVFISKITKEDLDITDELIIGVTGGFPENKIIMILQGHNSMTQGQQAGHQGYTPLIEGQRSDYQSRALVSAGQRVDPNNGKSTADRQPEGVQDRTHSVECTQTVSAGHKALSEEKQGRKVLRESRASGTSLVNMFLADELPLCVALTDLNARSVLWRRRLDRCTKAICVGGLVYCVVRDSQCVVILSASDGRVVGEINCPGDPREVTQSGPGGTVEVVSY